MQPALQTETSDWIAVAHTLSEAFAERAAAHDESGTFVSENFEALKAHRVFSMMIPTDLGGGGASYPTTCDFLRIIAQGCASTALTLSMHTHLVAATVWKVLRDKPGEELLRKVAADQVVLLSTGASDWVPSNGTLVKVEGGYELTARKVFGSGGPAADIMITSARYEGPDGVEVLHFPVPLSAPGVRSAGDWNTHGMRGTGSHTLLLDDVFVPDSAIALRRSPDSWHPAWSVAAGVALPLIMAVYVGIAQAAENDALALAHRSRANPLVQQAAGELRNQVVAAELAWQSGMAICDAFRFDATVDVADAQLVRKTLCSNAAQAAVDRALEVAGGRGFFRNGSLERHVRDVRAAGYHPLPERRQVGFTGRVALGLDPISGV